MIDEASVAAVERDMIRYYDAEEGREDRALDPRRVEARDRFISLVRARARDGLIVEIGTGPGRDALALVGAGIGAGVVGVDLSPGHAARAAARGLTVAVASARALPLSTGSVAALWSMSTLMHIPSVAIDGAMREIARVLAPGATVAVGVWGGPDVEHYGDIPVAGDQPRRLFSRRSEIRWRTLLEHVGRIDDFEVWEHEGAGADAFRYHLAFLTAHS